jgi:hypothetical protein
VADMALALKPSDDYPDNTANKNANHHILPFGHVHVHDDFAVRAWIGARIGATVVGQAMPTKSGPKA